MAPLLCRLGLHKWKNFGEVIMTTWKEPGAFPGTTTKIKKYLQSERKCSRCGIMEKRIFADNPDGTKAPMGWTKTSDETQKSED